MFQDGQILGDFEILGRLGQGGMGAVYKAKQVSLDRLVALKTLQGAIASNPEYIARFRREAKAAAALNHPNLVQVHAAGESDGLHWFAMEYVEGESAQDRMKRKTRLDAAEAIGIGIHIATALDYGWRKAQLIHRDIKPDNIFLSSGGEVKLGDLGLAKSMGEDQSLTMTGASMGTPHYVSPEQAEGKKDVDLRADIYSLGCTLFHLVSGEAPYKGDTAMAVMLKHVTAPVPDPQHVWPGFPGELARVVMKMMLKQPAARQQTYAEVIADLRGAHDALTSEAVPQVVAFTDQRQPVQPKPPARPPTPKAAPADIHSTPTVLTSHAAQPHAAASSKFKIQNSKLRAAIIAAVLLAVIGTAIYFAFGKKEPRLSEAERAEKAKISPELQRAEPPEAAQRPDGLKPPTTLPAANLPTATKDVPEDVRTFGGHRYAFVPSRLTWLAAKAKAEAMGGHLAAITSREEHEWVVANFKDYLKVNYKGIWMGGWTDGKATQWNWVTGEPFSFTVWGPGEPNGIQGGDQGEPPYYLSLFRASQYPGGYAWNDSSLTDKFWQRQTLGFLVEWDDDGNKPSSSKTTTPNTLAIATKDAPFVNSLGMKFVPVPGTKVLFSIWDTRVQDYAAFAKSREAAGKKVDGSWKTREMDGVPVGRESDHPVVGVSWEDAQAFCVWLSGRETADGTPPPGAKYRLPTDAEWSAAVGLPPDGGAPPSGNSNSQPDYPWGNEWPPKKHVGNYADETFLAKFPSKENEKAGLRARQWLRGYTDGYAMTSPVGSFPANAHGLFDMGGNVWQWCEDWFNENQKFRVIRGAAWSWGDRENLKSSWRRGNFPTARDSDIGFRCVFELAPSPALAPSASSTQGKAAASTPTPAAPGK